jgi:hypothetical protein
MELFIVSTFGFGCNLFDKETTEVLVCFAGRLFFGRDKLFLTGRDEIFSFLGSCFGCFAN